MGRIDLTAGSNDLPAWVEAVVKDFIADSPRNTLKDAVSHKAWAEPVVGFSNGADPLYRFYKEDIGDFYLSPEDWFTRSFPDATVKPKDLAVISWILPHPEETKASNRAQTRYPSELWARARIYGEEVNDELRRHVVDSIHGRGYSAVAPLISPLWRRAESKKYGYASIWSERHAAYAAGLGTFGLCDGLITPVGKAMRCGSVVTDIPVPPSPRLYNDHHAYCLFYAKGICGKCIGRCPAGAIGRSGHDKVKCSRYVEATRGFVREQYGFTGYGCGLCQTGVPCESGIPIP